MQFVWNKITNKCIYSTKEDVLFSRLFPSSIGTHKIENTLVFYNVVSFIQLPLDWFKIYTHTPINVYTSTEVA